MRVMIALGGLLLAGCANGVGLDTGSADSGLRDFGNAGASGTAEGGAAATGGTVNGGGTPGGAGGSGGVGVGPGGASTGRTPSGQADAGGGSTAGGAGEQDGGGRGPGAGGSGSIAGCNAPMLPVPDDPSLRGPWDVGVRTVKIGRLTTEVLYPAQPGSTAGKPESTYDVRDWLPASERSKVPADHSPAIGPIGGHYYRDVPIDTAHGPYPVVIFIHGTASMRIASASVNATWASRGFVVLAADYPGMFLADILCTTPGCTCAATGSEDVPGDVTTQIQALSPPSGDLAFLADRVDTTRLGISGHSQGGCIAAELSTDPSVQIVIPMSASFPVAKSPSLKSVLFVAGAGDTVIGYNQSLVGNWVCPIGATSDTGAYQASPGPTNVRKRLVGITGGGHLVPTDLCQKNAQGNNAIQEAHAGAVCGIDNAVLIGLPALFDCGTIDWKVGVGDVTYATTAALEETLMCKDRSAQFASLKANLPDVGDFQEAK